MPPRNKMIQILFTIGFATGLAWSCTRADTPQFKVGDKPFPMDPATVRSLEIAKADPQNGDQWAAKLVVNAEGQWEIQSGPGGSLLDRKANSGFVLHLLDTLRTLQIEGLAAAGPAESFGLAPPRFALRWSDVEIRFGKDSYAQIGKTVYQVKGAALKMLEYIENFHSLRQLTLLAPLIADDFDEVEIFLRGKSVFYAQREGTDWTDRQHRKVRPDVNALLEKTAHERVASFVDDAAQADRIRATLEKAPFWVLSLKNRKASETRMLLDPEGHTLISTRAPSVFKVHPEFLQLLETAAREAAVRQPPSDRPASRPAAGP